MDETKLKKSLIGVGVIAALLAAFYFGPLQASFREAKLAICLSNLRQIGSAMDLYLADSNNRFPINGWQDELFVYTKNRDLFVCPARTKSHQEGYAVNAFLMGSDASKVEQPDRTPLVFDTDAAGIDVIANYTARNRTRHGDGTTVRMVGGTTKFER